MQVNNISRNSQNFKGLWNNKVLLKGLEKVSEHGTTFAATTALAMSLTVRPLAIFSTPDVEKENKQYAVANSISSGLMKFAIVEAVALPIEAAVKNIDKNPSKYLKASTIRNLSDGSSEFAKAKPYKFGAQIMKLGTGFLTAIPKSALTIALIPVIMDNLFRKKEKKAQDVVVEKPVKSQNFEKEVPFTGNLTDKLSRGIGKIFDNDGFQKFIKQNVKNEKDIAKHTSAATDVLLTSAFAYQTNKTSKIEENRKRVLILNNTIPTVITLVGGYGIDRAIKERTSKFIEKFSKINANDPKLHKYIEGINIVRPAIIFAGIYYGILPLFSTYIAEKIDKLANTSNS